MESINELVARYPGLAGCKDEIVKAADLIIEAYKNGKCVYTCGNGGSASDADHIVGELMKGFIKKRPVPAEDRAKLAELFPDNADFLADNLQCGLGAMSLHSQNALSTAFANDVEPAMLYAQAVYSIAKEGDVLISISTSGNSKNVVYASQIAKIKGVKVITMTGEKACKLDALADVQIHVGDTETYRVQELHLPVYHWICARVEEEFFPV